MKNKLWQMAVFSALLGMTVWAQNPPPSKGTPSSRISTAQVQTMLDSIDKACLNKDAAAVLANYASNAVITSVTVQNGQTYTSKRGWEDYLHTLEDGLKNAKDYSLQHKNVVIEIAPDGQTAQCRFTLVERWRGNSGGMEEGLTKESLSLALLGGRLLITKDRCDASVAAQTGVPEANTNPSSARTVSADYSTPTAAAKSYFAAMQAGDGTAVRNACVGSSEQKEWTVQFARGCLAAGKLDAAATARFGRDETLEAFKDDLKRTALMMTDALAALPDCDVKIDGTNATITAKPGTAGSLPDPVKLQKVAGQWKVLLDLDVAKQDFNTDLMEAMATSQEKCAADIKAGHYKTAAEAAQAQMSAMTTQYMQKQKAPAAGQTENPPNK